MGTFRWPEGRGRFIDRDSERIDDAIVDHDADDGPLVVQPGETIAIFGDWQDHYQDRGFVPADAQDGSDADDGGDEPADDDADPGGDGGEDGFDAEAFTDRTPVSDVVDDIEAGDADGHLDAVVEADDRVSVQQAVEDRKDAIGGG